MQWPDDPIDAPVDVDEESFISETFDRALMGRLSHLFASMTSHTFMTCPTCNSSTCMKT